MNPSTALEFCNFLYAISSFHFERPPYTSFIFLKGRGKREKGKGKRKREKEKGKGKGKRKREKEKEKEEERKGINLEIQEDLPKFQSQRETECETSL